MLLGVSFAVDACATLQDLYRPDLQAYGSDAYVQILDCLKSIKSPIGTLGATMDIMDRLAESNAFTDVVADPPAPFTGLKLDVRAALTDIRAKHTDDDVFDLHSEIRATMRKLRDPHSIYVPPPCLTEVSTQVLPFAITPGDLDSDGNRNFFAVATPSSDPSYRRVLAAIDLQAPGATRAAANLIQDKCLPATAATDSRCQIKSIRSGESGAILPPAVWVHNEALAHGYASKDDSALFNGFATRDAVFRSGKTYDLAPAGPLAVTFASNQTVSFTATYHTTAAPPADLDGWTARCGFNEDGESVSSTPDGAARSAVAELVAELGVAASSIVGPDGPAPAPTMTDAELDAALDADLDAYVEEAVAAIIREHADTQPGYTDFHRMQAVIPVRRSSPLKNTVLAYVPRYCPSDVPTAAVMLHLADFMPPTDHLVRVWAEDVVLWARTGARLKAAGGDPFMVISVVGNGGGIITLGYLLANAIAGAGLPSETVAAAVAAALDAGVDFPSTTIYPLTMPYDFPKSTDVTATLIATADHREPWLRWRDSTLADSLYVQALDAGELRTKAGSTRQWSGIGAFVPPSFTHTGPDPETNDQRDVRAAVRLLLRTQADVAAAANHASDVFVLTDGTCGSTCATFMSRIAMPQPGEQHLATVIAVGGQGAAPAACSFAGGSVLDTVQLTENGVPDVSMPHGGYLRFAATSLYPLPATAADAGVHTPGEFVHVYPDFWVNATSINMSHGSAAEINMKPLSGVLTGACTRPQPWWAVPVADDCPAGEHVLISGRYNESCVALRCENGFVPAGDACVALPASAAPANDRPVRPGEVSIIDISKPPGGHVQPKTDGIDIGTVIIYSIAALAVVGFGILGADYLLRRRHSKEAISLLAEEKHEQ